MTPIRSVDDRLFWNAFCEAEAVRVRELCQGAPFGAFRNHAAGVCVVFGTDDSVPDPKSREYVKLFWMRVDESGGRMIGFGHDDGSDGSRVRWAMALIGIAPEDASSLIWDCWLANNWNQNTDRSEAVAQLLMDVGECAEKALEDDSARDDFTMPP